MRRIAYTSLLAMALASPALADGLPSSRRTGPITSTKITCYVGAFVSGAFEHANVGIVSVVDMNMGNAEVGGGPEIGCDYITSRFLIGVLADYTFQSDKTSNTVLGLTGTAPIGNEGAVLGRIGVYTNDLRQTLLYVAGGVAIADEKRMVMQPISASMPFSGGTGYIIGGGIETDLTAGLKGYLEYRHEGFDTRTGTLSGIVPTRVNETEDKIMAGVRIPLF